MLYLFFFFKQKTAYEMRISDWSSDVCSSDLIVKARTPWGGDEPGILVLCHLDTVHPVGTLGRNSFRREGDKVFGPGIYDMKGGAFLALYALQHLIRQGRQSRLPVTILYVPDEEVGSPISRAANEARTSVEEGKR